MVDQVKEDYCSNPENSTIFSESIISSSSRTRYENGFKMFNNVVKNVH
jgi:hypothetical protein